MKKKKVGDLQVGDRFAKTERVTTKKRQYDVLYSGVVTSINESERSRLIEYESEGKTRFAVLRKDWEVEVIQ